MIAVLIPFFLTSKIAVDDATWQYGPEYKFRTDVNITLNGYESPATDHNFNASTHLLCRPKGSDTLSCHWEGLKVFVSESDSAKNEYKEREVDSEGAFDMIKLPFEIKFDQKGVESVSVPKKWTDQEDFRVTAIKMIASSLQAGIDLTGRADGEFEETESFALGECMVNFNLRHVPRSNEENQGEKGNYELSLIPPIKEEYGKDFHLTKHRNVKNCSVYHNVFIISAIDADINDNELVNVTSNIQNIHVTESGFTSHSYVSAIVLNEKIKNAVTLVENSILILESIEPATEELPKVEDPVISGIFVFPEN